ncbi:hypothetical protein [Alkalicoccobacillus gibsonii]|uniref:hypothetical protein n=1 Tax=Alkalicoccobacillus gibsonii TaxID=79881 RepID=UPI0019319C7B|nr:hypothetical protein [Alkalicoccobacillus gibsonii]MBM0067456.1 hypothetical protein [Alkalicoccobacillus gibsonii]
MERENTQETRGKRLALGSIALMLISMTIFYTQLIADAGIYIEIILFAALSITGITLAIYSGKESKRSKLFVIGVVGNSFMLMISGLLFFVMLAVESST